MSSAEPVARQAGVITLARAVACGLSAATVDTAAPGRDRGGACIPASTWWAAIG
ncbi:MAG: hypothetical protein QOF00_6506 [Pseudonocardiales bacterium]|jgi:hypothetical protein|nr:hypothetical protein [Pseudonocardiales bacterium]